MVAGSMLGSNITSRATKRTLCYGAILYFVAQLLTLLMHYRDVTINVRLRQPGVAQDEPPSTNKQYNCSMAPQLTGTMHLEFVVDSLNSIEQRFAEQLQDNVPHGARGCNDRYRVAIVTPYRNRPHLLVFLNHIHRLLGRQRQQYGIFIVEPLANGTFNRAKLLNIGYTEALKIYPYWDCFIFHDVDLLADSDRNLYWCGANDQPRCLCTARKRSCARYVYSVLRCGNETVFIPTYNGFMGSACAVPTDVVRRVNGHSNNFWGWGSEDNNFGARLRMNNYKIMTTLPVDGNMIAIAHGTIGTERGNLINSCAESIDRQSRRHYRKDGLNTLKYKLLRVVQRAAYIHLFVDTFEKESKEKFKKNHWSLAHCY